MTAKQQNQLEAIASEIQALSANPDAVFDICTFWPVAKKVLQALEGIAPFPLNLLVEAIIAFGDKQCGDA